MSPEPPVLLSPTHPRVKAVAALAQKKMREAEHTLLVEGRFPIEEAFRAGLTLTALYRLAGAPSESQPAIALGGKYPVFEVSEAAMRKMATTDSPPPCLATVQMPRLQTLDDVPRGEALLLVLDGVRDPGNAGTLIRSAVAFGARAILTTPGTVDGYSPKVIRASAGLVFRLPLMALGLSLEALADALLARGAQVLLTRGEAGKPDGDDADTTPQSYRQVAYAGETAIVLGNEGRGIGMMPAATTLPGVRWISIAMAEGVDSLNVGVCGSILLAEAAHQRAQAS